MRKHKFAFIEHKIQISIWFQHFLLEWVFRTSSCEMHFSLNLSNGWNRVAHYYYTLLVIMYKIWFLAQPRLCEFPWSIIHSLYTNFYIRYVNVCYLKTWDPCIMINVIWVYYYNDLQIVNDNCCMIWICIY